MNEADQYHSSLFSYFAPAQQGENVTNNVQVVRSKLLGIQKSLSDCIQHRGFLSICEREMIE